MRFNPHNNYLRLGLPGLLVVAALALSGCGLGPALDKAAFGENCAHGPVVEIEPDDSGSTRTMRGPNGPYQQAVSSVLVQASRLCATVTGMPVRGDALTTLPAFEKSFTTTVGGNSTLGKAARARKAQAMVGQVRSLLTPPSGSTPGSDILGAMKRAGVTLAQSHGRRRILVVETDGFLLVTGEGGYNAYNPPHTPAQRRAFIARLHERGELPKLSGVEVYVGGLAVGAPSRESAKRVLALWKALLPATGAKVMQAGTDTSISLARSAS